MLDESCRTGCWLGNRFLWPTSFHFSSPLLLLHPCRHPAALVAAAGCSPWPGLGGLQRGRSRASVRSEALAGERGTCYLEERAGRTVTQGPQIQRRARQGKAAEESLPPDGASWWGCSPDSSRSPCGADPLHRMSLLLKLQSVLVRFLIYSVKK